MTSIVQLPPTATLVPQLLLWAKSPEAEMVLIDSGPVPVLDSVTLRAVLVVPTAWLPKARDVAES